MKDRFRIYYCLTAEELKAVFADCYFYLDTNVLLDCVRLRPDLGNKLLKVFEKYKERIYVPHHAAYEYHNHIAEEIARNKQKLTLCKTSAEGLNISTYIPEEYSLYLDHAALSDLESSFRSFKEKLIDEIGKQLEYWNKQFNGWEIAERVSRLLSDRLLPEISKEDSKTLKEEALKRYAEKIPPGFCDDGKDGNKEGDYIIWTEILKNSEIEKSSAIFISQDLKCDWMERPQGMTNGPRHELRAEFYEKVPEREFHAYTIAQFLRYADPGHEIVTEQDIADIDSRRALLKVEQKKTSSSKNEVDESDGFNKNHSGKNAKA